MVRNAYGMAIPEKNRRFSSRKLNEKKEKVLELGREKRWRSFESIVTFLRELRWRMVKMVRNAYEMAIPEKNGRFFFEKNR